MIYVNSSNLNSVDYNSINRTLTIKFNDLRVYEYYDVPQYIFEGLINAPSKGKFHHRYIKNSFAYNRIM